MWAKAPWGHLPTPQGWGEAHSSFGKRLLGSTPEGTAIDNSEFLVSLTAVLLQQHYSEVCFVIFKLASDLLRL